MGHISRTQSRWLAGAILCAFFLIGIILLKTQGTSTLVVQSDSEVQPTEPAPTTTQSSGFTLNSFHRSQSKDGKVVWEVTAAKGEYYPETSKVKIFDGKLLLFKKNDQAIELQTKEALLTLDGQSLVKAENSGGVKVAQEDLTLVTDKAVYDKVADSITAPGHVVITSDLFEIQGDGLTGSVEAQNFHLLRNVTTTLKPKQANKRTEHD